MPKVSKIPLNEWVFPESLLQEISSEIDLSSFEIKDELNPDIWENGKLKPEIREKLIQIAQDYYEGLELDTRILDIQLTGSLANYNWSRFSDVDLHILYDPKAITDEADLMADLINAKSRAWNTKHDITMKGFPVEIYMQPVDQAHHSTGVYSILRDQWEVEPVKQKGKIDRANIRKKYRNFLKNIEDIKGAFKKSNPLKVVDRIHNLKEKIRNMRKSGLERGGEFSVENLVFKLLRRNDDIQDLNDMLTDAYDNAMTVERTVMEFNKPNKNGHIYLQESMESRILRGMRELTSNTITEQLDNQAEARIVKLLQALEFKRDINQLGGKIYAVGGIVRDSIMGKESDDLDIVIQGVPFDRMMDVVSGYGKAVDTTNKDADEMHKGAVKFYSNNDNFNKMLEQNGISKEIDIMLPRTDKKDPTSRTHRGIVSVPDHRLSIEDDLLRRDLTINSIAISEDGDIVDIDGQGQKDIKNKIIRATSGDAFIEDPLRMLRTIRFATRYLGYEVDPETIKLIKDNAQEMSILPTERFVEELKKMIKNKADLAKAVKMMVDNGIYYQLFGVDPVISDYTMFRGMQKFEDLLFGLVMGHPSSKRLKLAAKLIATQEENEPKRSSAYKYISTLSDYIDNVRDSNLSGGDRVAALAHIYNSSPDAAVNSVFIKGDDIEIMKNFMGDAPRIPSSEKTLAYPKGQETQPFFKSIADAKGIPFKGEDIGRNKRAAVEAVQRGQIPHTPEAVRNYILSINGLEVDDI